MKLIESFIIFYLMFWWVMSVLTKDNMIQNRLEKLGQWIAYKRESNTDLALVSVGFILASLVYYASRSFYFMIPFMPVLFLLVIFRIKKIGLLLINLSMCKFCIENHTATIMAIGYYFFCQDIRIWLDVQEYASTGMDNSIIFWGFLCASINSWIREFIE